MEDRFCKYKGCTNVLKYSGRGRPRFYCEKHSKVVRQERKRARREKDKEISKTIPEFKGRIKFEDGHWISISAKHNQESYNLWKTCITLNIGDLPILITNRRRKIKEAIQNKRYDEIDELKLQIRIIEDAYIYLAYQRDLENSITNNNNSSLMFDDIGINMYGGIELKKVITKRIYDPDHDLLVDKYDE